MARCKQIYEFRLTLEEVRPRVWHRFQVPADWTLARLHKIIQALMDWRDGHLHEFTVAGRVYSVPDPDDEGAILDERTIQLKGLGISIGDRIEYLYDFGDDWRHRLELEDSLPAASRAVYPVCVGGECSAPPEDVGSPSGYEEFLEALSNPQHEEHEEVKAWVGRSFDPRGFSITEANERLCKRLRLRRAVTARSPVFK